MNLAQLEKVRVCLEEFESASPYDTREIETCMETLATQIALLMKSDDGEPDSLAEAVELLPIGTENIHELQSICTQLQELLEVSDYDSGDDEDVEDSITNAKSDFFNILGPQLVKLSES